MGVSGSRQAAARLSAPRPPATPARLRQGLYRLFGSLFLYPHAERVATLRAVSQELLQDAGAWEAYRFGASLVAMLEELAALAPGVSQPLEEEYNRLFAVKPAAPPYASVYLDPQRKAVAMITLSLERAYAGAGLAIAPGLKEPHDHLAVELEYMAFLCSQEAAALEARAPEAGMQARDRQLRFLERHLSRWFGQFVDRVSAASPARPYDRIVRAADAFVGHELNTTTEQPGMAR